MSFIWKKMIKIIEDEQEYQELQKMITDFYENHKHEYVTRSRHDIKDFTMRLKSMFSCDRKRWEIKNGNKNN